uniref:Uncharacterized protein n=1 Tax=Romanomermis culicivorax TaxID=13658 RepID=A0A915IG00_ROMCU
MTSKRQWWKIVTRRSYRKHSPIPQRRYVTCRAEKRLSDEKFSYFTLLCNSVAMKAIEMIFFYPKSQYNY